MVEDTRNKRAGRKSTSRFLRVLSGDSFPSAALRASGMTAKGWDAGTATPKDKAGNQKLRAVEEAETVARTRWSSITATACAQRARSASAQRTALDGRAPIAAVKPSALK